MELPNLELTFLLKVIPLKFIRHQETLKDHFSMIKGKLLIKLIIQALYSSPTLQNKNLYRLQSPYLASMGALGFIHSIKTKLLYNTTSHPK